MFVLVELETRLLNSGSEFEALLLMSEQAIRQPASQEPKRPGVEEVGPRTHRLTASEQLEIISRYLSREPVKVIARSMNIHRSTVNLTLTRAGVPLRIHPRKLTTDDDHAIHQARLSGTTTLELAKQYSVGVHTIRRSLKRSRMEENSGS